MRISKESTETGFRITYTRNKTGYFVRPESSIRGGRSSITFNSNHIRKKARINEMVNVPAKHVERR